MLDANIEIMIPSISDILDTIKFKSAYSECLKNAVFDGYKNYFYDCELTDRWLYSGMVADYLCPTFEPWLTNYGASVGFSKFCSDYILFSRIDNKKDGQGKD